ncbi:MAG: hypothetical protein MHM6MM_005773 [Cercozoa sp. M6MM]
MSKKAVNAFWRGFKDGVRLDRIVLFLLSDERIRSGVRDCVLLNLVLCVGSVAIWELMLRPSLLAFVLWDVDVSIETRAFVDGLLHTLFLCCCAWPFFVLSFALNSVWYQHVADVALSVLRRKPVRRSATFARWRLLLAGEVHRSILVVCLLLQVSLLRWIPSLLLLTLSPVLSLLPGASYGIRALLLPLPALAFVCGAVCFSYYYFDFRFAQRQWESRKRIAFLEEHAVYFCGFGAPSTLLTWLCPGFVGNGIWSTCFALLILLATKAKPQAHVSKKALPSNSVWVRMYRRPPVFAPAVRISDFLFSALRTLFLYFNQSKTSDTALDVDADAIASGNKSLGAKPDEAHAPSELAPAPSPSVPSVPSSE